MLNFWIPAAAFAVILCHFQPVSAVLDSNCRTSSDCSGEGEVCHRKGRNCQYGICKCGPGRARKNDRCPKELLPHESCSAEFDVCEGRDYSCREEICQCTNPNHKPGYRGDCIDAYRLKYVYGAICDANSKEPQCLYELVCAPDLSRRDTFMCQCTHPGDAIDGKIGCRRRTFGEFCEIDDECGRIDDGICLDNRCSCATGRAIHEYFAAPQLDRNEAFRVYTEKMCFQEDYSFKGIGQECVGSILCARGLECTSCNSYDAEKCAVPLCASPCRNGGRCIDTDRCWCTRAYTGKFCETQLASDEIIVIERNRPTTTTTTEEPIITAAPYVGPSQSELDSMARAVMKEEIIREIHRSQTTLESVVTSHISEKELDDLKKQVFQILVIGGPIVAVLLILVIILVSCLACRRRPTNKYHHHPLTNGFTFGRGTNYNQKLSMETHAGGDSATLYKNYPPHAESQYGPSIPMQHTRGTLQSVMSDDFYRQKPQIPPRHGNGVDTMTTISGHGHGDTRLGVNGNFMHGI